MAEKEQASPFRGTLGDYVMYQGPRHFSSIAIPATAKALEINPDFLTLISAYQFITMEHEDSYSHLDTFYELVGVMGFNQMMLIMFVCTCFHFHWQLKLKSVSNHFQIRASLVGKR